jgi:basic membrane protein A and related proteins
MVFDAAGKDDKSFNTAVWRGAQQAEEELGIFLCDVEPGDVSAIEPALRAMAETGFQIILGVGFINVPYVEAVASEYPKTAFAVLDAAANGSNVASVTFDEHHGSYLVGYAAGLKSTTGICGLVGGMDIPLIRRFALAYEAGVKAANPSARALVNYAGVTPAAWSDPNRGKELALAQYAQGADVIFAAAGATGLGVFDAAEETGKLVIGCDSNQNYLKPGLVLTSMLKRLDVATFELIRRTLTGKFEAGNMSFGLGNGGMDVAIDNYNRNLLTEAQWQQVLQVKQQIIDGDIAVPDYYDTLR